MTTAETRAVLTQDGEVQITFDESGRNTIAGAPAAIRAFDRALLTQVNRYGIGVTLDSLQPDDLQFVAGQGSGLVLGDPPMLDEVDPPPMPDQMIEDDEDDFDGQDEFDAIPPDADPEGDTAPVLDGDFKGHPFRGNQHRKASAESGSAVGASIKAKRAEGKGDKKAAKSAHRGAHYAHMAAAEGASGKARKYHRTMAKFHGKQAGVTLDGVDDVLDDTGMSAADLNNPGKVIARKLLKVADEVTSHGTNNGARALDARWAEGAIKRLLGNDLVNVNLSGRQYGALASAKITLKKERVSVDDLRKVAAKLESAKFDDVLDGVEDLPGLRAQLAAATSTLERLRLANAIKAARVAPPAPAPEPAPPPAPAETDASRVNALKRLVPKDDIRSDDPQLIEKLTAKLNYLSAWGEFMRKANRLFRKGDSAGLRAMGITEQQQASMAKPDFAGRTGFPDYMMSNNNGVIGNTRKRLEAALRDRQPEPVPPPPAPVPPPAPQNVPIGDETIRLLADPLSIEVYARLRTPGGAVEYADLALGAIKAVLEWKADAGQYELRGRTPDGQEWQTAGNGMGNMLREFAAWAARFIPAKPAKTMEQIALETLQSLGWAVSQYGPHVLIRTFVGMGRIGTVTVPDGRRNVYAKVAAGDMRVNFGDQVVSSVTLAATEEEVQAQARVVNADVEAFAASEAKRTNPPAVAGPKFRYALVNRPADLGAIPKVPYTVEPRPAAGQPHHDMARHGILVTERELTEAEVKSFELAPLVEGNDLGVLAEQVARAMAEYASGYLEQAKDEPAVFAMAIRQTIEQSASGIQYSVSDPALLAQMVRDKLAAAVPAPTPPAADTLRAADLALLTSVAAGTHPQMLEPELAEMLEELLTRRADDAEIQALGERAIVAYSNGAVAATEGAAGR